MRDRVLSCAVLRRLRHHDGFTLTEMIVVLAILGTVLAALVGAFTSASRHQIDLTRRENAYANARLALQRMRADIHCAGGSPSVDQNAFGGFTLTLTENHQGQDAWCPGVIPAGSTTNGVQWCTVQHSGSTTRWVLFRFLGNDPTDCGGSGSSTFEVDYIAAPPAGWPTNTNTTLPPTSWNGNIWPDPATCASGSLPTIGVDLSVALDPVNFPKENYELRDEIALRNANRC
jgi:prepilin-type N-terminal cleavage/methylation domain-containing protein